MDLRTFRRMLDYFRLFYGMTGKLFIALIALAILGTITELVSVSLFIPLLEELANEGQKAPQHFQFIYDFLKSFNITPDFSAFLFLILGIFWVKAGFVLLQKVTQGKILSDLHHDLRVQAIDALAETQYPYFAGKKSGYFNNLLTREVGTTAACFKVYAMSVSCLVTFLVYLVGVFVLDPVVAVWSVVFGAMSFIGLRFLFTKARQYSDWITTSNSDFNHHAIEMIGTFKYLKGAGLFGPIRKKLRREVKKMKNIIFRQQIILGALEALSEPLAFTIAAAYVFFLIQFGGKSISYALPVIYLLYRSMRQLSAFQSTWQKFENDTGAIDFTVEAVHALRHEKETSGQMVFNGLQDEIRLEGISVFFHGRQVLHEVTLPVEKGKVTALVGESGSGKSTLVNVLLQLIHPHAGVVKINGKESRDISLESFRSRVGYVPQDYAMYHDTVAFNIAFGKETEPDSAKTMEKAAAKVRADAFINRLRHGYDTVVGDRGNTLSGGECQRLHLARELFRKPEILILDEATKNLDAFTEDLIFDAIYSLRPEVTTLVVSHRLSLLDRADMIHVLVDGRVVESGTYESLVANQGSRFRQMWQREQAEGLGQPRPVVSAVSPRNNEG